MTDEPAKCETCARSTHSDIVEGCSHTECPHRRALTANASDRAPILLHDERVDDAA